MESALWRAIAVFRALGLGYAVLVYALRYDEYRHPAGGWLVLAFMTVWTLLTAYWYRDPAGRRWSVHSVDLAVAMAAVVVSRFLDEPSRIASGAQTLPVVWAAAPVLVFAVRGGWRGGVVAAAAVALADLAHRGFSSVTVATANNIVLLLLAGIVVGYVVALARRGEAALARGLALEAATRERERLSREIHDGVLQVLALVGRRGASAGGEAAEIGRLAAEQERKLRSLVAVGAVAPLVDTAGTVDLRALLTSYSSSSVTVSTPGTSVLVGDTRGRELASAVGAALANVADHAGSDARAWVLLEDEGDEVVLTVRDDGDGFVPGRLAEAAAQGRLGVAGSIIGRLRALGGTVVVTSVPGQGTEVEMRCPREVVS